MSAENNEQHFIEIENIQKELKKLEKELDSHKHNTDKKIEEIYNEMEVVGERTDKIENLTEELADIIKGYNEQLENFHKNLEYLNNSIDELKDSKRLMEKTRVELNDRFDSFTNELKLLVASYDILKNIPEKINDLAVTQGNMKTTTDSIRKFVWIFVSGIVVLITNEVFGDLIGKIVKTIG